MPKITVHGGVSDATLKQEPVAPAAVVEADYSGLSVAELRNELKERGLPVYGRREDLIERLKDN